MATKRLLDAVTPARINRVGGNVPEAYSALISQIGEQLLPFKSTSFGILRALAAEALRARLEDPDTDPELAGVIREFLAVDSTIRLPNLTEKADLRALNARERELAFYRKITGNQQEATDA